MITSKLTNIAAVFYGRDAVGTEVGKALAAQGTKVYLDGRRERAIAYQLLHPALLSTNLKHLRTWTKWVFT